jgi:DNA adenine methylase
MKLKPFIKWAGGKTQLLPDLIRLAPPTYRKYHEPFLGGGALFFALQPDRAVLCDINYKLVNTWLQLRDNPLPVIEVLSAMKEKHCESFYYTVRGEFNCDYLGTAVDAARFIYLNKTGYNGLYRVNKGGGFNSPFGKYKAPSIFNLYELMGASVALQGVSIGNQDFLHDSRPKADDFVYLDPPYDPIKEGSFTSYSQNSFGKKEQNKLADRSRKLADRGVKIMLSNSDTPFIRGLYPDFKIHEVLARRSINSNGADRGAVKELIITSY